MERVLDKSTTLLSRCMPQLMIKNLANFQTMGLNTFPVKLGISATVSPRAIMTHEVINYKTFYWVPFGSYV